MREATQDEMNIAHELSMAGCRAERLYAELLEATEERERMMRTLRALDERTYSHGTLAKIAHVTRQRVDHILNRG